MKTEIQKILDRNFTRGDNAKALKELCVLFNVSERYLFWFESEGKDGWTFEIEAEDSNDAYDKAYDTYGPQVAGMMYQVI